MKYYISYTWINDYGEVGIGYIYSSFLNQRFSLENMNAVCEEVNQKLALSEKEKDATILLNCIWQLEEESCVFKERMFYIQYHAILEETGKNIMGSTCICIKGALSQKSLEDIRDNLKNSIQQQYGEVVGILVLNCVKEIEYEEK